MVALTEKHTMPVHNIDFREDVPVIRKHITSRVRKQAKVDQPISAINVCFQLCQAGLIVFDFDTRKVHARDGQWTLALDGPTLKVPRWRRAYESADEHGISFVLLDGKTKTLKPGAGDEKVAGVFGLSLLAIVRDAIATGMFQSLNLTDACQLDMEEFDGMWGWPTKYDDVGRTNILRKMKPALLPK